jgi:hypothetical protein
MANPRNPHNMPVFMDYETHYLLDQIEKHHDAIGDVLRKTGMQYYTIGMIRIPRRSDRYIYEVWIVPHSGDVKGVQKFEEFDHTASFEDYDLLFHVVNWPDEWTDQLSGGWPEGFYNDQ